MPEAEKRSVGYGQKVTGLVPGKAYQISITAEDIHAPEADLHDGAANKADDVRMLEKCLVKLGYMSAGEINGVWDATTKAALEKFQAAWYLEADHWYGKGSREAMKKALQGQTPPPPPEPDKVDPELEKRLKCVYSAAKLELSAGAGQHGTGTWESNGANRGPLVDKYQLAAGKGYLGQPWCGCFVLYAYLRAGMKKSLWDQFPYTPTLDTFLNKKARHLKFPQTVDSAFLEKLAKYGPRPGEVVTFDKDGKVQHTGVVAGYDSTIKKLYTIEGNSGDKAAAHAYDLTKTDKFKYISSIGAPNLDEFDKPSEVGENEGPEPSAFGGGGGKTR